MIRSISLSYHCLNIYYKNNNKESRYYPMKIKRNDELFDCLIGSCFEKRYILVSMAFIRAIYCIENKTCPLTRVKPWTKVIRHLLFLLSYRAAPFHEINVDSLFYDFMILYDWQSFGCYEESCGFEFCSQPWYQIKQIKTTTI